MSDWDVDSYKTSFESEEHWELRRNFMLAHKDKLPEDEVVCLAQVFTNIELLGCRYPEETMQRVAELAKGVVEEYREKRKSCLKRTFVAASAAAVAKVKGQRNVPEVKMSHKKISEDKDKVNTGKDMDFAENRCIWHDFKISSHTNSHTEDIDKENGNKTSNKKCKKKYDFKLPTANFCYTLDPVSIKQLNALKPRFVFFLYDEPPVNLLQRNASLNKGSLRWQFEGFRNLHSCAVYYNNIFLGASDLCPKKRAKEIAAKEAIRNLRSLCYTIKIKAHVKCLNRITPATLASQDNEIKFTSSIGIQIMKQMGWEGGGLGVKQQGITQPIILQPNIGRGGLGLNQNEKQDNTFKNDAYTLLRKWMKTDTEEDLVFSSEFTHSQRDLLHKYLESSCVRKLSGNQIFYRRQLGSFMSLKFGDELVTNQILWKWCGKNKSVNRLKRVLRDVFLFCKSNIDEGAPSKTKKSSIRFTFEVKKLWEGLGSLYSDIQKTGPASHSSKTTSKQRLYK